MLGRKTKSDERKQETSYGHAMRAHCDEYSQGMRTEQGCSEKMSKGECLGYFSIA